MEVVASLSQGRTAAAQCGLFTHKSVPVIFEPPCIYDDKSQLLHQVGTSRHFKFYLFLIIYKLTFCDCMESLRHLLRC